MTKAPETDMDASGAPAELWLRKSLLGDYYRTRFADEPDAVRYVRADLYDKRMAEPVNQEPLGFPGREADYPR